MHVVIIQYSVSHRIFNQSYFFFFTHHFHYLPSPLTDITQKSLNMLQGNGMSLKLYQ